MYKTLHTKQRCTEAPVTFRRKNGVHLLSSCITIESQGNETENFVCVDNIQDRLKSKWSCR